MPKKVIYGYNIFDIEDETDISYIKNTMVDLFPELCTASIIKDDEGNYHFILSNPNLKKSHYPTYTPKVQKKEDIFLSVICDEVSGKFDRLDLQQIVAQLRGE